MYTLLRKKILTKIQNTIDIWYDDVSLLRKKTKTFDQPGLPHTPN